MLQYPQGYDSEKLLAHVSSEYNSSIDATREKRRIFAENEKIYLNIKDNDTKILSKFIRGTVQTLRSLHYVDECITSFSGRQIGSEAFAHNVQKTALFDYEEMKLAKKRFIGTEDKFKYGPMIEVFIGWNYNTNTPISTIVDPTVRVPDLNPDPNYGPRFHGFEYEHNEYNLTENLGYDQVNLKEYIDVLKAEILKRTKLVSQQGRGINENTTNPLIKIYHHYTTVNGIKYHVTCTQDFKAIIRCVMLRGSTLAEKIDPSLVQFPVIVRNWLELRYDPRGVNIFDILADKQMAMQLFDNLARIKAEYEAFGDLFLVDPKSIPDLSELQKPAKGPKFLHANNLATSGGVKQVEKGGTSSQVWNIRQQIQTNSTLEVGMDERTLGVSPNSNLSATENQRVQANANLRITLGLKGEVMAEKQFWKLWHSYYRLYFKKSSKKIFQLTNDLGGQDFFELEKNDIVTDSDIDVTVRLKSDIEAEKAKKKLGYMALYGSILNDPGVGQASKNFAKRKVMELNELSPDEVMRIYPYTSEEEQALLDLELLNRDEEVADVEDLSEDHFAFIMIYDMAKDTSAKQKAIKARRKALLLSGQKQPMTGGAEGDPNSQMGNMLLNQMMQNQPMQAETLPTMS